MAGDRCDGPEGQASVCRDGMVSVDGAVQFTTLSKPELYRLMAAGKLRYAMYGKRRLIPKSELVRLMEESMVGGPKPTEGR